MIARKQLSLTLLHFLLGAQFQHLGLQGLLGFKIDEDCLAGNRS